MGVCFFSDLSHSPTFIVQSHFEEHIDSLSITLWNVKCLPNDHPDLVLNRFGWFELGSRYFPDLAEVECFEEDFCRALHRVLSRLCQETELYRLHGSRLDQRLQILLHLTSLFLAGCDHSMFLRVQCLSCRFFLVTVCFQHS